MSLVKTSSVYHDYFGQYYVFDDFGDLVTTDGLLLAVTFGRRNAEYH